MKNSRIFYRFALACVIPLGLASRRWGSSLPTFVADYAGDTLWAMAAYFGMGLIVPNVSIAKRTTAALAFSYAIELSQLYHGEWIERLRSTTLGGLLLGFGFLWSDLLCYTVGVAIAAMLEILTRHFWRAAVPSRRLAR